MLDRIPSIGKVLTKSQMVDIITKHEVFAGFNEQQTKELHHLVSYRLAEKNETIFHICDVPDYILFLVDGSLTLNFPDRTKVDILPNELIGEIGILNGDFRLGTLVADKDSRLIAINTITLFDSNIISTKVTLEIMRRLSKRVTNYLRSIQQTSTKEIIKAGEDDHVEFKSTLRWNLKLPKKILKSRKPS